jgi:hypothetical protein
MIARRPLASRGRFVVRGLADVTISPPRPGPTFRQRLTWFMTGFAVTAGMGLYQLASDASDAATQLDAQLKSLREETHHTQKNLRAKIASPASAHATNATNPAQALLETEIAKKAGGGR